MARQYDREHTYAATGVSQARIREGTTVEGGEVIRFVRQIEYRIDGEWQPVVRYDHGPSEGEHDVGEEGLHIDVYRHGSKDEEHSGPIALPESPTRALTRAEDDLQERFEEHIKRFERWHDLNPDRNSSP